MISVELLPAAHGDSIWIEYGTEPELHRILIDGGPAHTYESGLRRRIAALGGAECKLDLMVVTHIDADHIDGALILLQELDELNVGIDELWFNGWDQLPKKAGARAAYAPLQGEFLGGLITVDPELEGIWNQEFDHEAVVVPDDGDEDNLLPEIQLDGDAKLILLGPGERELHRLRSRWSSAIRDFTPGDVEEALRRLEERRQYQPPAAPAIYAPAQYGSDRSPANGSSISFVFERDDVAILFAGDAHARSLALSLERLAAQRRVNKVRFDAVKLPHHGSMGNVTEDWLKRVDCERWLISTNGDVFHHPDVETAELVARHCQKPPTMFCNYRSTWTERLEKTASGEWVTVFPEGGLRGPAEGLRLNW